MNAVGDEGVKNGALDTLHLLRVTLVLSTTALVLQLVSLAVNGPTNNLWWVYVGAVLLCTLVNGIALASVKTGDDYTTWISLYAWTVYGAITGMVYVAYLTNHCGTPNILGLLPAAAMGLASIVGMRSSMVYTSVIALTLLGFGILLGDIWGVVSPIGSTVVGSWIVSKLRMKLHIIRVGIKAIKDAQYTRNPRPD